MASRAPASLLAVALLAALVVPSAVSQSLPTVTPGADHTVIAVQVPIAGAAGSGSFQVPVDGGILDIQVDPILLPGPGGSVDVEAYLAEVRMLLPSGVAVPLPSMVIRAEDQAIDGPAAQALAELAASAEALRLELEAMADEVAGSEDPDPEPEPEPAEPDPVAAQLAALQAEAEALAAEAGWIQALADEAAGAVGAGAAEQAAIAHAMLARVEAGLALLQKGLDSLQATASSIAEEAGVPAPESPEVPEMPSGSESASSAPAADPDSSSAPAPPDAPDPAEQAAQVLDAIAEAQAQAESTAAQAEEARGKLEGMAGAISAYALGRADALVDEQAALDGALKAVALAQQAVADRQAGAEARLAELQAELEASGDEQSEASQAQAEQAAAEAQAALDEALAHLQWAHDWVAEAQAMAGAASDESLANAAMSIDSAQRMLAAVHDIADRYLLSQSPVPVPAEAQAVLDDLPAAMEQLDDAVAAAQSAHDDLESALGDVASQDPAGGLEPIPEAPQPGMPELPSMPGAPGAPDVPTLPPMPGMPVSFDTDAMAVCVDSLAAQACFHYRSPVDAPPGSVTVLIALPTGTALLDDPLGSLPIELPADVDPSGLPIPSGVPVPIPSEAPSPDPEDPAPTSSPSLPIPLPTGLPILPGSSSSSSSAESPSEDPDPSSSSSSTSLQLPVSSSSQSSSSAPAGSPHLLASADRETLGLRMGEQDSVVLTVRNDGTASDVVRVTAQTDAPIAYDATDQAVTLAPGQSHDFVVRITPVSAGSGTLDLLATGDKAGTVLDSVLVAIEAAPSPEPMAAIAASLDPTAIQSAVGQATAVTVRLANEGDAPDLVSVKVAGQGMLAEPSELEVLLEPGEAAAREVWITPTEEGASQVVLSITSDRGADLSPIVVMDTVGSLMLIDDDAMPEDEDSEPESKDSPSLGLLATGAAVGLALLARRRLRSK